VNAGAEIIPISRVKDGERIVEDMEIEFAPETLGGPAVLLICCRWLKRAMRWGDVGIYEVTRKHTDWNGRAYSLSRSADSVDADPQHVTHYAVFIGTEPADDVCDCRGHHGCEKRGHPCKHTRALRHLVEGQRI